MGFFFFFFEEEKGRNATVVPSPPSCLGPGSKQFKGKPDSDDLKCPKARLLQALSFNLINYNLFTTHFSTKLLCVEIILLQLKWK